MLEQPVAPPLPVQSTTASGQPLVLEVVGALEHSSVARFSLDLDAALESRPARVVVDLSQCSFVDASALTVLLEGHRRACRYGGQLTLHGCSPRVLRLLSLTGLRGVFDLGA